jgi:fibronectin-binding autotransporter adhesin
MVNHKTMMSVLLSFVRLVDGARASARFNTASQAACKTPDPVALGTLKRRERRAPFTLAIVLALVLSATNVAVAGQGASRMLYTVPNSTFVENPAGDSVVTINDPSGSIATLQVLINNARSANPNSIIVIQLLNGATYSVSSAGLVLGSQECLVGTGAIIMATNSSVTVPLITISTGSTNVSVAGGTLNGNGANIYGIYAPATAARVNIDKVTVLNCGQDCIQLNGNNNSTFDNEMTVTRCDVSESPVHAGISIQNATQATCLENNCHNNLVGIWIACAYGTFANNICESNTTGIDFNSGNDNYIANNTCNHNGTGILLDGSSTMVVSDSLGSNTVAGINSSGSGNIYADNLFTAGNFTNFISGGSGDDVVAYKGSLSASGQNYFYPPLVDNQHTSVIVNGKGRTDITNSATTTIDSVQSQYNTAVSANPGNVIVLHLNGTYTVGANPLTLSSYTCVLLGGTIQINSSTTAKQAITATSGASYISLSGGTIDGGTATPPATGRNGIYFSGIGMFQIDAVTLRNFGNNSTRVGGSDVIQIDHGSTPRIVTRCTVNGGSARGIWLATSGVRDIVSDNTVTDVQMDGVDCDESTSASLVKFNYLYNDTRYGVFVEQSASDNCILGNICNYDSSYGVGCYNNSTTPRGSTAYNSIICNSILGGGGLRNGSTGTNVVTSSDNFFFDNTVVNSAISSQLYGSQNYYSQNYLSGTSLSTSGTEVFFNSPDVGANLYVQDRNSGLEVIVTNASTSTGAAVITGQTNGLGSDQWKLIPTDSGYYQIANKHSSLALVVQGASTNIGASIIQWTYAASGNDEWMPVSAGNGLYSFVNRLSGLDLDVTGANLTPGTQLDQQPATGGANQQFNLIDAATPVVVVIATNTATWTSGGVPDGNWQTAANWSGNLPQAGNTLVFGSGPQFLTTNNLSPGTAFQGITFNNTSAGSAFTLYGQGILISGGTNGVYNGTILAETVNNNLALDWGNYTFASLAGSLNLNGALTAGLGGVAGFGSSNVKSTSLAVDGTGLISGLGGRGLIGNSGTGGGFSGLATITGGTVSAYGYTGASVISAAANIGAATPAAATNLELTATAAGSYTNASGNTFINTVLVTESSSVNLVVGSVGSGALVMGTTNAGAGMFVGGFYLPNGQSSQEITIGGGSGLTLTAGPMTGNPVPGEIIFAINGTSTSNEGENNATTADNGSGGRLTVVKTGTGSMYFANANTYSGGTYIDQGYLQINNSSGLGGGPVYIAPGAELYLQASGGTWANNINISPGVGPSYNNMGAIKIGNGSSTMTIAGTLNLLGAPVTSAPGDRIGGSGNSGTVKMTGQITGTGTLELEANAANAGYLIANGSANTNNWIGGLIIDNAGTDNNDVKLGASNQLAGNNVTLVQSSSGYARLDLNGFNDTIGGLSSASSTLNELANYGSGSPALTLGGGDATATYGGVIGGGNSLNLIKTGAGTQTLTGNNTYTGGTTVNAGTLALGGSGSISNTVTITVAAGATLDASGRPDQTLTLNSGQTLQGGGTINVNLTVGTGATVLPGNATNLGTLTVASAAQLQGTTLIKLNATSGTSDQINASSFIYGGTLTVTNLSGTLTAGQSFQPFLGDAYSGTFSVTNLPPLSAGLVWSNNLAGNGQLTVVSTIAPLSYLAIASVSMSGTNLMITGTNAGAGTFYMLTSTNLALPVSQWQPVATNLTGGSGNFAMTATNAVTPNTAQQFYILGTTNN